MRGVRRGMSFLSGEPMRSIDKWDTCQIGMSHSQTLFCSEILRVLRRRLERRLEPEIGVRSSGRTTKERKRSTFVDARVWAEQPIVAISIYPSEPTRRFAEDSPVIIVDVGYEIGDSSSTLYPVR